jgi:hypothetical protein
MKVSSMGKVRVALVAAAMMSAFGMAWAKGGGGGGAGCGDGGGVGSGGGGVGASSSSGDSAGGTTVGTWVPRSRRTRAVAALPAPVVAVSEPVAAVPAPEVTAASPGTRLQQ